jgi:hypothetical protein
MHLSWRGGGTGASKRLLGAEVAGLARLCRLLEIDLELRCPTSIFKDQSRGIAVVSSEATTNESPLMAALAQFEATEANLVKLERIWDQLRELIPPGILFGESTEYDDRLRLFADVVEALPAIDGWKPDSGLLTLDGIAQNRMDALELGEPYIEASVENAIYAPDVR